MDASVGTWGRAPDAVWRVTARGAVVLSGTTGEVLLLDGPAGRIWDLLDPPLTLQQLASRVAVHYDTSSPHVLRDLERTVLQMQTAGIVVQDLQQ